MLPLQLLFLLCLGSMVFGSLRYLKKDKVEYLCFSEQISDWDECEKAVNVKQNQDLSMIYNSCKLTVYKKQDNQKKDWIAPQKINTDIVKQGISNIKEHCEGRGGHVLIGDTEILVQSHTTVE